MSLELWSRAQKLFAGGVNSPVRAAVKPYPFFTERGEGAYIYSFDGNRFVDYVLGYGPLILGHSPEQVRKRVLEQVERGWLFGTPCGAEVELASKIVTHVPSAEKVRFVNSGSEATQTAIRLARAYTSRTKILKFDGNYHGSHDYVLVDAGSAASEFGVPYSMGVPKEVVSTMGLCRYGDLQALESKLKTQEYAAVIVEPVMGNMGVIPPPEGFLEGVVELCEKYGSLAIFDEVITGFRLGLSGAQGYYDVKPHLTTLGKIIGGGLPVGAVAGKRDILDMLTPSGKVFSAGTFSANPLTMAAGLATIEELEKGRAYTLAEKAAKVVVEEIERSVSTKHVVNHVGSMFQVFFGVERVANADEARLADRGLYSRFQQELMKYGVFIPPSQ
ncbi:MAG: glutamate-1-semialdehyde 2,1-aminomutase, partial [Thermoprotei archaeon]